MELMTFKKEKKNVRTRNIHLDPLTARCIFRVKEKYCMYKYHKTAAVFLY